jgi:hypothetical protein
MGQGSGRREEGEDDGIYARETKIAGAWVKKELNSFFPRSNQKHLNTNFSPLFKVYNFGFMTVFI